MQFLLPNRFKRTGTILAPLGLALWLAMQQGVVKQLYLFYHRPGFGTTHQNLPPSFFAVNTFIAITGFFGFLFGLYFLAFSKEKVEDEMIAKIRLDSFQFAALAQLVCLTASFGFIAVSGKEPDSDGGFLLFFIGALSLFWLSFLVRFNLVLYKRRMKGE